MSKYSQIITKLFDANSAFVPEDFYEFVGELTGKYPEDIRKFQDKDSQFFWQELPTYVDKNEDKMAILIYKMPSRIKVERARSEQRNLISGYLRNKGVFESINSVLVAFYSDDSNDWRLSFIKQEFKLSETELDSKGRQKIVNELTPAKRYSFLVESNSKNLTVKQRLNDLIQEKILISDIEKAFSVEKVSKEFFERYVGLYERLAKAFENDEVFKKVEEENSNGDEHFRENFVKKLLGQIVFLYFLQKKGWLGVKKDEKWGDGDKNFLQNLLKECLEGGNTKKESGGKNFFNDYLEWLFYDNLNRKRENDYSDYFEYRIPYLNGGLFEPINSYDWKGVSNILLAGDDNNAIFRDIFGTFDEYNFTVYENDPLEQDVAVDPEMLGKVFENLLPENERKGKGAFYTPREIVHYMCKESLKNHLINKTGISEELIEKLFTYKDSYFNITKRGNKNLESEKFEIFEKFYEFGAKINESLISVKIVDPAVGSGAFPMGLLKEIVSIRRFIEENVLQKENVSEYQIKKETLENCIYGVDIDPGAVEIAKLRFWLSLVIEEDSKESIDPLPNLDYKIMQGNSLIEDIIVGETIIKLDIENNFKKLTKKEEKYIGNAGQIGMGLFADEKEQEDILKKLKFLHKRFFQEKDNILKKKIKEEIDNVEKELIRISGEVEVNKLKTKIESIEGKYLLSGMTPEMKDSREIERLNTQIGNIKEMEEKYRRDNVRTFFPWKLHFAEVFNENGGFDIVIGNPPYDVYDNKEKTDEIESLLKSEIYKKAKGGKINIYRLFLSKSVEILREQGLLSQIFQNSFLADSGTKELRKFFLQEQKILCIDSYPERDSVKKRVFESAKMSVCILFSQNIKLSQYTYRVNIWEDRYKSKGNTVDFTNIETLQFDKNFSIQSIKEEYKPIIYKLGKFTKLIELGRCWTGEIDLTIQKQYLRDPDSSFYPMIKGAAVQKWYMKEKMSQGDEKYIEAESYLNNNKGKKSLHHKHRRIVMQGITGVDEKNRLKMTILEPGIFCGNSVNYILLEDKNVSLEYILCLMNSKILNWFFKVFSTNSNVNGYEVDNLPIPLISSDKQKRFSSLALEMLEIKKSQSDVIELENQMNTMVYELYGLNPDEIKIIEESMK